MNLNFWVSLDTLFTLVVSIVALASGHAISIAPYVVTVLATAIVIFLIAFETLSYHTCLQIWKNMITAEHSVGASLGRWVRSAYLPANTESDFKQRGGPMVSGVED
jgi:hypothetical protein